VKRKVTKKLKIKKKDVTKETPSTYQPKVFKIYLNSSMLNLHGMTGGNLVDFSKLIQKAKNQNT
jgi:hypothetical protein